MAHRVLVVDDEDSLLFTIEDYFGTRRYAVDCARNMEEATALLSRRCYAAVIVDLRLQGSGDTGGLQVLAAAKELAPASRRILLTAYGSAEVEREARRLEVDAYLLKPQSLAKLVDLVESLLHRPAATRGAGKKKDTTKQ
jgi:DNA-binding NtrC family response regulator